MIVDDDILAFGEPKLAQLGYEDLIARSRKPDCPGWTQNADAPHSVRLLRARRERPSCRRAADKRHELAPSQIELHSVPASQGRIAGYRTGEDQSGGSRTILQAAGRWPGRPTFEVSRNAQHEQTLSGYPTIVSTPILSGLHHRYARI